MRRMNKKKRKKSWKNKYEEKIYEQILNRSRRAYLYGEIDIDLAYKVNRKLRALSVQHPRQVILLEINSVGGDIGAGMSIVDTILELKTPVYTIIVGEACSMASLISIVGKKRLITEHSAWMTHASTTFLCDKVQNAVDRVKYEKKLEAVMDDIYKKHTKLKEEDLETARRGELWLTAKECKKKGVVDEIVKV